MQLLPVADAQSRLFALAPRVESETLPLRDAAGRWAAQDILANRTQPAADLSAMDGYAIRFADMPGPWTVIGESAAGRAFDGEVRTGEAVRIFTGAALPAGADTVLIQEEAARAGEALTLDGEGPPYLGRNTRARGLDFTIGDRLVAKGDRLTPARIAVAATGGHGTLGVNRRIRVAVAATGDELVPPGSTTSGLALPESNGIMIAAMLADLPVDIVDLGILPDRLETLRDAFAAARCDLLVTTGGASVGDHDLVRPAIEAAGGVIDFWRIALRPGKPMMAGRLRDATVLSLPGNPVSAFVTATLFVRPLVAHMAGARDPLPQTTHALLGEDLAANNARTDYMRAEIRDGRAYASTIQDSSMLLTLARSTCLIVRPGNAPAAKAGDSAEILVIA
ncbi:molybdopterin molybdotransferase MoeA [Sphingomonas ginsenosidivorax]|uniref:Molybdopterin molybdenumtransferase n=1 Tax=Sphingomonas ginsenosidivorax TaxID=862135 RepID=A0A5C6UJ51_9SPHN|nr:molybdopterin molybdotransferase MoeA [Sphingomonas ginsenosidivorax]TXC72727.1 molybdopterin molybdotransferase MoeA [Sphingomonas ginsenosidivorax]